MSEETKILREVVLKSVGTGCKAGELIKRVVKNIQTEEDILEIVEELVEGGELSKIEYSLSNLKHRIRSFYLPGTSEIQITYTNNSDGLIKVVQKSSPIKWKKWVPHKYNVKYFTRRGVLADGRPISLHLEQKDYIFYFDCFVTDTAGKEINKSIRVDPCLVGWQFKNAKKLATDWVEYQYS